MVGEGVDVYAMVGIHVRLEKRRSENRRSGKRCSATQTLETSED